MQDSKKRVPRTRNMATLRCRTGQYLMLFLGAGFAEITLATHAGRR